MSDIPRTIPNILPIFPLTGALLLPGGRLPLHIFEPRYRNMVEDALAEESYIGMIQPFSTVPVTYHEGGDPNAELDHPQIYEVGCAGYMEEWKRLPDGRFVILLHGERRFRVREELPLRRGYRRVEADYGEFGTDPEDSEKKIDSAPLLEQLRGFAENQGIQLDWDVVEALTGITLLNSLAMGLPFPPEEKQALLEAPTVEKRVEMLLTLFSMGLDLNPGTEPTGLN